MTRFVQQNWVLILFALAMLAMHLRRHAHGGTGGCGGGHSGHQGGHQADQRDTVPADLPTPMPDGAARDSGTLPDVAKLAQPPPSASSAVRPHR